jgi:integrase
VERRVVSPKHQGGIWKKVASGQFYTRVRPIGSTRARIMPTGTGHRPTALRVAAFVADLRQRGDHGRLLHAIAAGEIAVLEAFQLGEQRAVSEVARRRADATDVDTALYLDAWERWVIARGRSAGTAAKYRRQLELFWGQRPWLRSGWTPVGVSQRLDALAAHVTGSTANRYRAALSSFARYLVRVGVLASNPVRESVGFSANAARVQWYTMDEARAVIARLPEVAQGYEALMLATGMSSQEIARARVGDIDVARREVRAKGSKTRHRDRTVRMLDHFAWCVPYVAAAIAGRAPTALAWPGFASSTAIRRHRAGVTAAGVATSTLHDWRHTHAVLSLQAGESIIAVAHQLGHGGVKLAWDLYGRFAPSAIDYRTFATTAAPPAVGSPSHNGETS